LYDIQPGNGAGPFLQPRSPHDPKSGTEGISKLKIGMKEDYYTGDP